MTKHWEVTVSLGPDAFRTHTRLSFDFTDFAAAKAFEEAARKATGVCHVSSANESDASTTFD